MGHAPSVVFTLQVCQKFRIHGRINRARITLYLIEVNIHLLNFAQGQHRKGEAIYFYYNESELGNAFFSTAKFYAYCEVHSGTNLT